MAFYPRAPEKRKSIDEFSPNEEDDVDVMSRDSGSPKGLETEKRMRREIANSNERRRMQSINAGFQSLKTLIPHHDGEKLSKAAILMNTADFINSLQQEKTHLLSQNADLKQKLVGTKFTPTSDSEGSSQGSPPPKRKKRDTESSDEGIGLGFDEVALEELKKEMTELRYQLDRERRLRMMLEDQTRNLEAQLYPERLRQIATQVQEQMHFEEKKQRYLEEQRELVSPELVSPVISTEVCKRKVVEMIEEETSVEMLETEPPKVEVVEVEAVKEEPKVCMDSDKQIPAKQHFCDTSMSRRNLETIVEAIRHLEGEHTELMDSKPVTPVPEKKPTVCDAHHANKTTTGHIPAPAHSQEASNVVMSDPEDFGKSDSNMSCPKMEESGMKRCESLPAITMATATVHIHPHLVNTLLQPTTADQKCPIQLLRQEPPQWAPVSASSVAHHQMVQRPGVIVQKLC